jgi:hypothetical protein
MSIEHMIGPGVSVEADTLPAFDGGADPALALVHGASRITVRAEVDASGMLRLVVWGEGNVGVWVQSDLVLGGEGDD